MRGQNIDRGFLVSADPIAAARDLRQSGFYVGATQELTKWAIVGVRYDTYNPDADSRNQKPFTVVPSDSSVSTWSFVAAARIGLAKLIAQYDKRSNTLGRDAAGNPTTLADDSFTLRAEVRFYVMRCMRFWLVVSVVAGFRGVGLACVDAKVDQGDGRRVPGARRRSVLARADADRERGGPNVQVATFPSIAIEGRRDFAAGGELASEATGLAVGIEGDTGYWTLPASVPNLGAPDGADLQLRIRHRRRAPLLGDQHFIASRGRRHGQIRSAVPDTLTVNITARTLPSGKLVIALTWDTEADLDLHVVLPDGLEELFKRAQYDGIPD